MASANGRAPKITPHTPIKLKPRGGGLIDKTGKEVIALEFEDLMRQNSEMFYVCKNEKWQCFIIFEFVCP